MQLQSNILYSRFDWLTLTGSEERFTEWDPAEQDRLRTPIPFPEEVGYAWFTSMHLPLNIVIRRAFHHFKPEMAGQLFDLGVSNEGYREPSLVVIAARTGRFFIEDRRVGANFISYSPGCLFQHTDCRENGGRLETNGDVDLTVIIIGDSVLGALLGEERSKRLLQCLNIASMPSAAVTHVPRSVSDLLHASLPDHLSGNIGKLFAQAKVLEYICALTQHLNVDAPLTERRQESRQEEAMQRIREGTLTERRRTFNRAEVLQRVHADLARLEGKVPTLDELAQQYGLSARVLNDGFKKSYGCSIYAYLTDSHLSQSHAALLETEIPMKNLAMNLGYSHVNHFIRAFGLKYGYSPGSLRKGK